MSTDVTCCQPEKGKGKVAQLVLPKTSYELWTGRVFSLNYLRVWGSPAEAKVFNPNIGKLDPKTVSCHFSLAT